MKMVSIRFYEFIIGCSMILLLSNCSKDPLSIGSVPFDDLESSYYKLSSETHEIFHNDMETLVLGRTDSSLELSKGEMTADIKVGDVIVSSLDTPHEDVILRKIISIQENGSSVTYGTEYATILQAYDEYYFDSDKPNVVEYRGSADIKTIFEAANDVLNALLGAYIENKYGEEVSLELRCVLGGCIKFQAIHPNTAYKIRNCVALLGCDDYTALIVDETDSDGDGIWDVVEQFYGNLNEDIEQNGLYILGMYDFGVEEMSATAGVSFELSTTGLDDADLNELQPNSIVTALQPATKNKLTSSQEAAFIYLPTGITAFGTVSINMAVGPIMIVNGNLSAFAKAEIRFDEKVDIEFGHINWREDVVIQNLVNVRKDGKLASLTDITTGGKVDISAGIKGEMSLQLGYSVGLGITVGEANKAGNTNGMIVPVSVKATASGEVSAVMLDVFNGSSDDFKAGGQGCFDVKFSMKPILFTDSNDPTGIADFLDGQIEVPSSLIPFETEWSLLPAFGFENLTSDGYCIGINEFCTRSNLIFFNILEDSAEDTYAEFKFSNELAKDSDQYRLNVLIDDQVRWTSTKMFEYGKDTSDVIEIPYSELLTAQSNNTLKFEIKDNTTACTKDFGSEDLGLYTDCATIAGEYNLAPSFIIFEDIAFQPLQYYDFDNALTVSDGINKHFPTKEELESFLLSSNCKNPTGFLIPSKDEPGFYIKLNSHRAYYWIQSEGENPEVVEATFSTDASSIQWQSFTRHAVPFENVFVPVLFPE